MARKQACHGEHAEADTHFPNTEELLITDPPNSRPPPYNRPPWMYCTNCYYCRRTCNTFSTLNSGQHPNSKKWTSGAYRMTLSNRKAPRIMHKWAGSCGRSLEIAHQVTYCVSLCRLRCMYSTRQKNVSKLVPFRSVYFPFLSKTPFT